MREWLAGHLIHLAHRIYPPKVEDIAGQVRQIIFADGSVLPVGISAKVTGNSTRMNVVAMSDPNKAAEALARLSPNAQGWIR